MRADEFAIGVGFDERVLVRRDGIELDGSVYLDGKRQLIVQRTGTPGRNWPTFGWN